MMAHIRSVTPRSLRGLTIVFLGLFLTVTVLAGVGTYLATFTTIRALVDHRIESESRALAPPDLRTDRAEIELRIAEDMRQRDTADLGLLLTDAQGRRLAGNVTLGRSLPLGFSSLDHEDQIEGLSDGRAYVREIGGGMRLAVFAETEPIDHYLAARLRIYLASFGAIVLVVLLGLLLFRRLIGARIEAMRQTADSIIEGDLTRRVPVQGDGGEFDGQAAAFNRMLDRICDLMAQMRNVSNDISHELRTPLARLRGELALLDARDDAALVRPELAAAMAQADELLAMFGAILRIAEVESGQRRAGFATLQLDDLMREIVEEMEPVASESGHVLALDACDAASVEGDRLLLVQLLVNLIENGLRHTPPGARIGLGVTRAAGAVRLIVQDDGPGIPAADRALAMRRFGRLDRSRRSAGHGLGMPLVDAIVRLHGGTMALEDAGPGLRVSVVLPAAA